MVQKIRHAFNQIFQHQRLLDQFDLPGLDLREIEDVVDDVYQRSAAMLDSIHQLQLSCIQLARLQQSGHADDTVHGRADFMAHHRQEFALRAAGRLRLVTRGTQLLLDLAAALIFTPRHDHAVHCGEKRIQLPEPVLVISIRAIGQTDKPHHLQPVVNRQA